MHGQGRAVADRLRARRRGRILWASDFPHGDGVSAFSGGDRFPECDDDGTMTEGRARRILGDNVAELYGLGVHEKS